MNRERILKVVLVIVGLIFSAGIYPVVSALWRADQSESTEIMMISIYATLGIFLLMAARNPSANRSLIAFTAWSSFAHGAVMAVMAFQSVEERRKLLMAVVPLGIIGAVLVLLAPGKPLKDRLPAAGM